MSVRLDVTKNGFRLAVGESGPRDSDRTYFELRQNHDGIQGWMRSWTNLPIRRARSIASLSSGPCSRTDSAWSICSSLAGPVRCPMTLAG